MYHILSVIVKKLMCITWQKKDECKFFLQDSYNTRIIDEKT